jgi:hypothetical protein
VHQRRQSRAATSPGRLPAPRVAGHELFTVTRGADASAPPERFIRRLIAQRRIRFYKVGRHIRFDVTDLDNSIDTGRRVEPRL